MHWVKANREMEEQQAVLHGMLASLFSLAVMAAQASTRSAPVRLYVLSPLRRAEPGARALVTDLAQDCGAPFVPPGLVNAPHDEAGAIALAQRFYALALLLEFILAQKRLWRPRQPGEHSHAAPGPLAAAALPFFRAMPTPDTS